MSNCVWFHQAHGKTDRVVFLKDEIDVAGFKALVATAKDRDYTKDKMTDEEMRAYYAHWFLGGSFADDRGVIITFGKGRSGHTWRDFEGTLEVLKPLIKKPKYHTFCCTDESDGGKRSFFTTVEFSRVTINGKTREERDAEAKAYVDSLKIDYSKIKVRSLTKDGWVEGMVL